MLAEKARVEKLRVPAASAAGVKGQA